MLMDNVTNGIGGKGLFKLPKTILGFFAICLTMVGVISWAIISQLIKYPGIHGYIKHVLLFDAIAFAFIVLSILLTAWISPEKLMLGQVTGELYMRMWKLKQGDSEAGFLVEDGRAILPDKGKRRLLPPTDESEDAGKDE